MVYTQRNSKKKLFRLHRVAVLSPLVFIHLCGVVTPLLISFVYYKHGAAEKRAIIDQ